MTIRESWANGSLVIAALFAGVVFTGSLYASYRIGFEDGANRGYEARNAEQMRWQTHGTMAMNWQTYKLDHRFDR